MYHLTKATEHLEKFCFYKIRVKLLGRKYCNMLKITSSPSPLVLYVRAGHYKSEYAHVTFQLRLIYYTVLLTHVNQRQSMSLRCALEVPIEFYGRCTHIYSKRRLIQLGIMPTYNK